MGAVQKPKEVKSSDSCGANCQQERKGRVVASWQRKSKKESLSSKGILSYRVTVQYKESKQTEGYSKARQNPPR